ncbi:hypothetical protein RirG_106430 [Rhizophagus irregularis DAOM 197198w]|uniref:Uncharacterized protein n=1 Tax=Rhizophagus irregularis (strain DAOM 197198w) TaxID=1432141 RepID=A0A015JM79_RHIIW|nr:hypothetical protein RirG_106430 [Rhizophagus irregularis DAOM 197198w]
MEYTNLQSSADLENQPFEPVLQYSYNKYNKNTKTQKNDKKPQNHKNNNQNPHTPDNNNDSPITCPRNYIREPRNDEDENMLNYIEHHLFDDHDTKGSTSSTSQTHDAPISTSSQLRTQFIDYYKFGTINIQGGFNNKLNDILHFFTLHNYEVRECSFVDMLLVNHYCCLGYNIVELVQKADFRGQPRIVNWCIP